MLDSFRHKLAKWIAPAAPQRVRRFDGATGGRRGWGVGTLANVNSQIGAAGSLLRARSRYLAANNQWVCNGANNLVGALVGSGIRPTSRTSGAVEQFELWAERADADGRTDFYGLEALVARALVVDGESFVQLLHTDDGLRLRVLPAELIDESKTADLGNGSYVVQGVEFDADGKRIAYWVLPHRYDQFASYAPPVRVDAADVLHVSQPLLPGQVRGVSWLAPIILPANEFDQLTDALLTGVKVAAMFAGIVTDQNNASGNAPFDGEQRGNILETGLEPGTLKVLPSGWDIKFATPQQAQQTNEFVKQSLRGLAAGLGVPTHLLDGDLTGANYSSLRAGLIPFRQRVEQIQYHCLVPQFLNPVWRRVMALESHFTPPVEWLPPAWLQVDPLKAVEADIAEINAGLASRRQKVAERGWSIEQLDAEIAADRERERSLNLSYGER